MIPSFFPGLWSRGYKKWLTFLSPRSMNNRSSLFVQQTLASSSSHHVPFSIHQLALTAPCPSSPVHGESSPSPSNRSALGPCRVSHPTLPVPARIVGRKYFYSPEWKHPPHSSRCPRALGD